MIEIPESAVSACVSGVALLVGVSGTACIIKLTHTDWKSAICCSIILHILFAVIFVIVDCIATVVIGNIAIVEGV